MNAVEKIVNQVFEEKYRDAVSQMYRFVSELFVDEELLKYEIDAVEKRKLLKRIANKRSIMLSLTSSAARFSPSTLSE